MGSISPCRAVSSIQTLKKCSKNFSSSLNCIFMHQNQIHFHGSTIIFLSRPTPSTSTSRTDHKDLNRGNCSSPILCRPDYPMFIAAASGQILCAAGITCRCSPWWYMRLYRGLELVQDLQIEAHMQIYWRADLFFFIFLPIKVIP